MDKYFATLDFAHMYWRSDYSGEDLMVRLIYALDSGHDAGPEAKYIIRLWKEERGVEL